MTDSVTKCPIPSFQQPLNEYKFLQKSYFFSWSTLKPLKFLLKLLVFWLSISLLMIPIFVSGILAIRTFQEFLVLDIILSHLILIVLLVRLHLGWCYITQRLLSATVVYEESGWYDGQVWVKPSHILIQERLIGTYQVIPKLKIIKKVLLVLVLAFFMEIVVYTFSIGIK
uniref:Ycf36 n=1 Tax=Hildenbrandia rivularis TaxID=135206 RepID=A0A1C9CF91_9FLOR|nr:hypothetical protein Hrvl_018 [Hildenbrandia rivularis]AOM67078.1 hypothetical protein Hrvl_018 [Hildenbrandia rivularis]